MHEKAHKTNICLKCGEYLIMMNIDEHLQSIIDKYGYSVIGVFDENGKNDNALYTVGLTSILGYELVVLTPGKIATLHIVLTTLVHSLKSLNQPDNITHAHATLLDGSLLRAEIKDVTDDAMFQSVVTLRTVDKLLIKQFILADSNNLLPGENGHDSNWLQKLQIKYC